MNGNRRGLVLGCGGTVGGAWQIGALVAAQHALGWDPRSAEVIVGTSAGSAAAVMLGCGVGVDELAAAQRGDSSARTSIRRFFTEPPPARPKIPVGLPLSPRLAIAGLRQRAVLTAGSGLLPAGRTDPGFLDTLVDDLVPGGGWVPHPGTWIVAVSAASGERSAFGAQDAPPVAVRDAVRASWAIPGWYPPVTIAGERYVDGGAVSTASLDLLAGFGLDEVLAITPLASADGATASGLTGRVEGLLRRPMSRIFDDEVAAVEASGTRVLRVQPGPAELSVMGANFMDPRRRLAAFEAALRSVPDRLTGVLR